jgi:hypothetical protein
VCSLKEGGVSKQSNAKATIMKTNPQTKPPRRPAFVCALVATMSHAQAQEFSTAGKAEASAETRSI